MTGRQLLICYVKFAELTAWLLPDDKWWNSPSPYPASLKAKMLILSTLIAVIFSLFCGYWRDAPKKNLTEM